MISIQTSLRKMRGHTKWDGFYLSVRSEFSSTFLTGDRMIEAVRVLALITGCPHCLSGLGCNPNAFDRGCKNLVGSNETRWHRPLKVNFWFDTLVLLVFLHQIQSLWAVAIVVGLPIQCLFVLASLAIRW